MPFLGLMPFLLTMNEVAKHNFMVSMPLLGLMPFLQKIKSIVQVDQYLCQCPYSGSFHFYSTPLKTQ